MSFHHRRRLSWFKGLMPARSILLVLRWRWALNLKSLKKCLNCDFSLRFLFLLSVGKVGFNVHPITLGPNKTLNKNENKWNHLWNRWPLNYFILSSRPESKLIFLKAKFLRLRADPRFIFDNRSHFHIACPPARDFALKLSSSKKMSWSCSLKTGQTESKMFFIRWNTSSFSSKRQYKV